MICYGYKWRSNAVARTWTRPLCVYVILYIYMYVYVHISHQGVGEDDCLPVRCLRQNAFEALSVLISRLVSSFSIAEGPAESWKGSFNLDFRSWSQIARRVALRLCPVAVCMRILRVLQASFSSRQERVFRSCYNSGWLFARIFKEKELCKTKDVLAYPANRPN